MKDTIKFVPSIFIPKNLIKERESDFYERKNYRINYEN